MLRIENVLTREEVAHLRVELSRTTFHEGAETGHAAAKRNLQVDHLRRPQLRQATGLVLDALMRQRDFTRLIWPHRTKVVFNRYDPGMTYNRHADAALMGDSQADALRADCSFTLFLSDPDTYDGGDLAIDTPFGTHRFKERPGTVVVYDTLYVHGVEPVTRGSRLAAVGWIQSFIRSPIHRQAIHDLYKVHSELQAQGSDLAPRLDQGLQNLLRFWIDN
ncbi:Fe2+-dependent dioxygenase [Zavarzinia sp. CC-PAN008]|uniref:Fe2+-dependent dioxygenase n=1 Tax=Zavarzinia sp. CC-PAN008 TaxID=3243332 RepID=UPI003F7475B6